MWYQFDMQGKCVSTSTAEIEPIAGVISVWCDDVYTDIENLRLINGKVVHISD